MIEHQTIFLKSGHQEFVWFLTRSVQEKLKNSNFDIPIIPQILNINN